MKAGGISLSSACSWLLVKTCLSGTISVRKREYFSPNFFLPGADSRRDAIGIPGGIAVLPAALPARAEAAGSHRPAPQGGVQLRFRRAPGICCTISEPAPTVIQPGATSAGEDGNQTVGSASALWAAACRGPAFIWVLAVGPPVPPTPGGTHIPAATPRPDEPHPQNVPDGAKPRCCASRGGGMEGSVLVPRWERGCRDRYQRSPSKWGGQRHTGAVAVISHPMQHRCCHAGAGEVARAPGGTPCALGRAGGGPRGSAFSIC